MKKKIYIAGKVTGLPHEEVHSKFKDAQLTLATLGFTAVNPIEVVNDQNAQWDKAMKQCIAALMQCDAVILLPCWQESKGALIESELAHKVAIKVFHNIDDLKVWSAPTPLK